MGLNSIYTLASMPIRVDEVHLSHFCKASGLQWDTWFAPTKYLITAFPFVVAMSFLQIDLFNAPLQEKSL